MLKVLLVAILGLLPTLPCRAQTLEILTEEDPPYSFIQPDGTVSGAGVEIVKEIQKRIGNTDPIHVVPWARAYLNIQKRPNVVVFTMSRTKARDPLFYWVGPILENNWVIIARKDSKIHIKSLEDAMTLKSIGVVRGYAWTEYMEQKDFKNLHIATSHSSNARMLNSGRVQAMLSTDLTYRSVLRAENLNPDEFEVILNVKNVKMYVALSKKTSEAIVKKWQAGFQAMKDDGTFRKILQTWVPASNMPEYEEPAD
ncbi:MAG TPA: ABC transporter substrate-binding protein [Oligoflexus sp.]|uniref:substrate-binding periplasmic protein n=1 Tax=Oligoflexus sp. TaxID=1971216 RepID=UPI002D7F3408|nr:ABC transporter substrate-binding protein [Oligoflexus sp.]HET9239590.1 ABC transporter substrate-binding protein [Oligoflexus sp.]